MAENIGAGQNEGLPIEEVGRMINIPDEALLRYGRSKAKVDLAHINSLDTSGSKLVLVTAISPTPAGEGKTTTSIGLADGLRLLGHNAVLALREPSMGPVFGIKGGATGGGKSQLIPAADINLHFNGDFAAIAEANNLLAAMVDNALHFGTHNIDPRTVTIRRAVDVNDRALRDVVIGLGGRMGGVPRQSGFDITAASQIMATFCMASSLDDLHERLGRIVVGYSYESVPVTVDDLEATGALTAILRDALSPNLVQTQEGTPAFVHGGPFANIAHGCNSVIATKAALGVGDIVVTEAGFGADLGAEKFFDIKCRATGFSPDVTVVVATVRALKYHGGIPVSDLENENVDALRAGCANIRRHVANLRDVFGQRVIVAINQFASDTEAEITALREELGGVKVVLATHFLHGGEGAKDLAQAVVESFVHPSQLRYAYEENASLKEKAQAVVQRVYGGKRAVFTKAAERELERLENDGWSKAPVCIAKTQYSFTADAKQLGAPEDFDVSIREVRLSAGAGFVVLITGTIMTMPGLPKRPSACDFSLSDDGTILGMH
ncbi:MAG: formate--tetrahydrofolate ligase [Actinomycetaceae bacterium]|nr:formate--tetrahydrofolate ligase [Actinomycetaceae bacterium]